MTRRQLDPVTDRSEIEGDVWRSIGIFPIAVLCIALAGLLVRYCTWGIHSGDWALGAYFNSMCRADCGFYVQIATSGYDRVASDAGAANWAFFPLLPLLMAGLHAVTGWSMTLSGFLISQVAIVAAALISRVLFVSARTYLSYCVLLLAGPLSFYFNVGLSEALFVFLSTAVFVGLYRRNYAAVGVAAALLSATRVPGIFIVLAILAHVYEDHRKEGGSYATLIPHILKRPRVIAAAALAPLGLLLYMSYLQFSVGDALAFARVQVAWGRHLGNPFSNLLTGLMFGFKGINGFEMAIFGVAGLVLSGILFLRARTAMSLFCAACIVLPASTGLISLPRFFAGLAPLSIPIAEFLSRRTWVGLVLLAMGVLLGSLFTRWWLDGLFALV